MPNKKAKLILEDGTELDGIQFGAANSVSGEVVFNTGMVGYPESLTDPSYHGQILTLTYPLIGNYGVPDHKILKYFESDKAQISGLVVSEFSESYNHWNAKENLGQWLERFGVPGISGIDTRHLTKILRERGTMLGKIVIDGKDVESYDPNHDDLISKVCPKETVEMGSGDKSILLIDCGCKNSIANNLVDRGLRVIRAPWNTDLNQFEYDGIVLSNGPGNPEMYLALSEKIKELFKKNVPMLGICLGHQMLARASGAKTFKLKYGHRSQNQPVKEKNKPNCYVTSQNHGFAVDLSTLPIGWESWFENLNDGTSEGIRHKRKPWMSVQFHPEAVPGPVDTQYIFDEFIKTLD